jgi:Flp pilus assembly protein TadG
MIRRWISDRRGAAALEIALWLGFLVVPLLNVVDVGYYAFQAIQVRESAQAAAQAALQLCGPYQLTFPAATNCTGLSSAFTSAAQGTSLGTHVTVSTWSEGYYCMTTSGTLVQVGTVPAAETAPNSNGNNTCSSFDTGKVTEFTGNGNNSSDYLSVTASYTYKPLFKGLTIATLLTSPITATAIMRVG